MVSRLFAVARNVTCERSNGQVDVVILERAVLLGVEHLEQRRGRIAAHVDADLVDLVEDEHRVLGADLLQAPG